MNGHRLDTASLLKLWLGKSQHRVRRACLASIVLVGAAAAALLGAPSATYAATGDLVGTAIISKNCEGPGQGGPGIGVGITFDGTNLWTSCFANVGVVLTYDLLKVDPATGNVLASYNIAGCRINLE
jgi:hypothetical protein